MPLLWISARTRDVSETTQVLEPAWADDEDFYGNLVRVMKTLLTLRDMEPTQLAQELGIGRNTVYVKLKTGHFTANELRLAAAAFDVPVQAFYLPAERMGQNWKFLTSLPFPPDSDDLSSVDAALELVLQRRDLPLSA